MNEKYKVRREVVNGVTFYARVPRDTSLSYIDPVNVKPTDLPTTRVSQDDTVTFAESLSMISREFATVNAKFPLKYLQVMQNLSLVNPDVAQMVDNTVLLGNTGHKVVVEAPTEDARERILAAINEFALSAFSRFGGLEGFINSLFAQVVRAGAVSNEWVIANDLSGVEKAVLVAVSSIVFVRDPKTSEFLPHQKVSDITLGKNGLIPLNTNTYQYCGINLLDNSPYGTPPILAALETLMIQREIIKNIRFVAKKMGLLGFITMLLKAPDIQPGETADSYRSRCAAFLQENAAAAKDNYRDGIAVGFKENFEIEHHSVMDSAAGAKEIFELVEQQVFSGLKADPAMHGRSYSTTETYAGVVYEKMLSSLSNYQRVVAKVLEYGFKLHLVLNGIVYDNVYVEFEPSKSLASERDETAYQTKLDNLNTLYYEGIISQEQRAQEAGYDAPDLPAPRRGLDFGFAPSNQDGQNVQSKKRMVFKREREANAYSLVRKPTFAVYSTEGRKAPSFDSEALPLSNDDDFERLYAQAAKEFSKTCGCEFSVSLARETASGRRLKKFMADYFRSVYPPIKGSRQKAVREVNKLLDGMDFDTMDSEMFADEVFEKLADAFGVALQDSPLLDRVRTKTSQIYRFYRLTDKSIFEEDFPIQPNFNVVDQDAVRFLRSSDNFYFGRYVTDPRTKDQLKSWLSDEFLESGRSLRDPGEMEAFRKRFGDRVAKEDYKVVRVVETSVTRAKNWGNVFTAEQAKARTIGISGPGEDGVTCDWCLEMIKKTFKVRPVVQHVKDVLSNRPEDLPDLNPFIPGNLSPETVAALDPDQLLAQGIALPPYHPHCRHRFVVEDFE